MFTELLTTTLFLYVIFYSVNVLVLTELVWTWADKLWTLSTVYFLRDFTFVQYFYRRIVWSWWKSATVLLAL